MAITFYMFIYTNTCRNWCQHLRSDVRDPEHQLEIYQMLNLLLQQQNVEVFTEELEAFTTLWAKKEPKFMDYFKLNYANHVGMYAGCTVGKN